ncbi:uncharacterized protein LOC122636083 [Vespula pensylvanica]|uniref:CCHC-type domain-containing protein n=1 Tax=Vespula pensylvanica TaxID=30213 RepID=A0A834N524_VESPE|nr:uncharacterized protein LOC122636083 [Vespula pensylvanica]KAF7397080.1 hypothetical protein H0235_016617 [Vespula pensylvanica]
MENHIRPPQPLSNNSPKTWLLWKEEFIIFMKLLGHMSRPEYYKANLFKNFIGPVGLEIISKLSFDHPNDKDNLDIIIKKIDEYHNPPRKEIERRYQFFNSSMKSNETIENYIQSLKEKAKECKFDNLEESLIIDVVILHAKDKELRKKYLQENNLNCEKIIEIYKNHRIATLESSSTTNSTALPKQKNKPIPVSKETESSNVSQKKSCWRCKSTHEVRQCPAWNYKCKNCGELHHFEISCRNVASSQNKPCYKNMNNLNKNGKPGNHNKTLNNLLK